MKNIIGSGFLAKKIFKINTLIKKRKIYIYAAGISNSSTTNKRNLKKEINKIYRFHKIFDQNSKLIYISTLSVNDRHRINRAYVKNKIIIESFVIRKFKNYIIVRLPEVIGKNNNKKTLTNFLCSHILRSKKFKLWDGAIRNLIDIDDIVKLIKKIVNRKYKNKIIEIKNDKNIKIKDLVVLFEKILGKKAVFKLLKNKIRENNKVKIKKKAIAIKLLTKNNYITNVIKKYYL
jgi:nucleoside-diphosphate-sugar epimerase